MCAEINLLSENEIRGVIANVIDVASDCAYISEERAFAIRLVLSELLANCFEHAGIGSKRLVYEVSQDSLRACILDGGAGFDWRCAGTLPLPESESGRGIFLARELADELRYNRKGTIVYTRISL